MLPTNAIDFYTKIKEELLKIKNTIEFIEQNNPIDEKQEILIEFLKSESSSNGMYQVYNIKKVNFNDSEKLKSSYMTKYKEFKKGFDFMVFFGFMRTNITIITSFVITKKLDGTSS